MKVTDINWVRLELLLELFEFGGAISMKQAETYKCVNQLAEEVTTS